VPNLASCSFDKHGLILIFFTARRYIFIRQIARTMSWQDVRPSVAYIANNSRIQRLSVPKFGKKVPHLRCDSHTSFKVKRSKVNVTRPINADTHRAPRPTNFKLGIWMEDNDPHQPQVPWPPRSKVKVINSHRLYVSSLPLLNSGNKMLHLCH